MIPSRAECLDALESQGVPENIRSHCLQVSRVAMFLARRLRSRGIPIDMRLVEAASLLHDIDKHRILASGDEASHGIEGAGILEGMGYREVAAIVRSHGLYNLAGGPPGTWEEKVVHYADMRVNRDSIVSLDERMEYIRRRYGSDPARLGRINRALGPLLGIEKEIMAAAGLEGGELGLG
jgi:uncharacterized protein